VLILAWAKGAPCIIQSLQGRVGLMARGSGREGGASPRRCWSERPRRCGRRGAARAPARPARPWCPAPLCSRARVSRRRPRPAAPGRGSARPCAATLIPSPLLPSAHGCPELTATWPHRAVTAALQCTPARARARPIRCATPLPAPACADAPWRPHTGLERQGRGGARARKRGTTGGSPSPPQTSGTGHSARAAPAAASARARPWVLACMRTAASRHKPDVPECTCSWHHGFCSAPGKPAHVLQATSALGRLQASPCKPPHLCRARQAAPAPARPPAHRPASWRLHRPGPHLIRHAHALHARRCQRARVRAQRPDARATRGLHPAAPSVLNGSSMTVCLQRKQILRPARLATCMGHSSARCSRQPQGMRHHMQALDAGTAARTRRLHMVSMYCLEGSDHEPAACAGRPAARAERTSAAAAPPAAPPLRMSRRSSTAATPLREVNAMSVKSDRRASASSRAWFRVCGLGHEPGSRCGLTSVTTSGVMRGRSGAPAVRRACAGGRRAQPAAAPAARPRRSAGRPSAPRTAAAR